MTKWSFSRVVGGEMKIKITMDLWGYNQVSVCIILTFSEQESVLGGYTSVFCAVVETTLLGQDHFFFHSGAVSLGMVVL